MKPFTLERILIGGSILILLGISIVQEVQIVKLHQEQQKLLTNQKNTIPTKISEKYIEESSIIETVQKTQKSVVSIVATKDLPRYRLNPFLFGNDPFQSFFNPQKIYTSQTEKVKVGGGSGFVYDKDLILTNNHVIADKSASYTVVLSDGTELPATVLATDALSDIALLKLQADKGKTLPELSPIALGDSQDTQIGQRVIAIGNALAEFQNTVTSGIVSAKGRSITAEDGMGGSETIKNLIQTDAAINPGNSGGPLMNLNGQVIGMNTAIAEQAQGIGFAIPINSIKKFAEVVKKHGKFVRPYLGVRYIMLDEKMAKLTKNKETEGALILESNDQENPGVIKESPADKAGIKPGDIITHIDGEKLSKERDIKDILSEKDAGSTLYLDVLHKGKKQLIPLKLELFDPASLPNK